MKDSAKFDTLLSVIHIRSTYELISNLLLTAFGFIGGYFKLIATDNINVFMAITIVVLGDWTFGTLNAIKENNWQTKKAMKLFWYLTAYNILAGMILVVEKGFPSAFFLSEAIMLPIIIFMFISTLKNICLLGLITNKQFKKLLDNIDRYKSNTIDTAKEQIEQP